MSSLAAQLQGIASLDASRLTSRTGAPSSKSYLFTPAEAAQQDYDEVYSIALEGYTEIVALDPEMSDFESELFSDVSKRTDRMMLSAEDNAVLDEALGRCLRRLGRWVGVMAAGKCLEWLVRRFRVHEMNADTVLQVFLPYHESPNFARMLSILTISPTSPYYAPFHPLIKDAQTLPRAYITTAISPAKEPSLRLLNDVVGMVPAALKEDVVHRAMLNFWSATIVELLEKKNVGEGLVKALVEAFVVVMSTPDAGQDVNAAVYPPLVLLTRSIRLADGPFLALLSALLTPSTGANPAQRILTLLVILDDRKGWTGGLGAEAPEHLSRIKFLGETLEAGMVKYGFTHALPPILAELVKRPDLNALHLRPLIYSPSLSTANAALLANALIAHSSPTSTSTDKIRTHAQTFLSSLRERHPSTVDRAIIVAGAQDSIPHLLKANLTVAEGFADVYAADVADRIRGVSTMLSTLQGTDETNKSAAKEALLVRLVDGDLLVVQAVYAGAETVVQTLHGEYVEAVRQVFVDNTTGVEVLRAHLAFVDQHLLPAHPELGDKVFEQLVFPSLFATADRAVFVTPTLHSGAIAKLELMKLVSTVLRASRPETSKEYIDAFNQSNAVHLSSALVPSTLHPTVEYIKWTKFLISRLTSTYRAESALAQLVLAEMLQRDPIADRRIALAYDTLQRISAVLPKIRIADVAKAESPPSASLFQAIYADINAPKTVPMGWACLLVGVSQTLRQVENVDWIASSGSISSSAVDQYRQISTTLYNLINSGTLHPKLASHLLRSLFTRLGEDALVFFASIWTGRGSTPALRVSALRHALAFVNAYKASAAGTDFQMVLPALVVAMMDENKEVRAAGVAVLKAALGGGGARDGEVYAVDSFYGSSSNLVQLLKPSYLDKYLSALIASGSNIILDPSHILSIHSSTLSPLSAHNKKDKGVNRAIIASLLSHISAWRSLTPRLALLRSLGGIHDSSILRGVLPVLSPLVDGESDESKWLATQPAGERGVYLGLLVGTLDKQSAGLLGSPEGDAWKFFEGLLTADAAARFTAQIRPLVLTQMTSAGVFDVLPHTLRTTYLTSLIRSLHILSSSERFSTIKSLALLRLDSAGLIAALTDLSAPLESSLGKKRQRQDDASAGTEAEKVELAIGDITVLLESREWASMPGSAALVAGLMGTLSALLTKRQMVKEGVDYLEQELLGAILAVLEKITDTSEVSKSHIGIESIIKTIRSTSNPRTSERALLVAAELARLIPDQVLHNVMPIFTFMGAADFQRDDAYSFGVVERTIKGIVPVLVGRLRETASSGLVLWNASANFVRIFTDMAAHLPKHRTLPFFAHLVDALGRADYLAPISMLLIDRTTSKAGKSSTSAAIDLALGVAATSSVDIKLNVILDVSKEVSRLLTDITTEDSTAFLSQFSAENEDSDRPIRRMTSLLNFSTALSSKIAIRANDQPLVQEIVRELVTLFGAVQTSSVKHSDVPLASLRCLGESMKLLSAENFLGVVKDLAESDDQQDIQHALDLFAERLPLIKPEVRARSTAGIAGIVRRAAELLSAPIKDKVLAGLVALRAVVVSAIPAEDSALAAVLPKFIDALSGRDTGIINEVLSLLELSTRHLGPRIIPSIQPTLNATLALIARPTVSPSTTKASFTVISAIIETVPTFIGANQLGVVLRAAIDNREKSEESSTALITTCAKKIPTKVLFPVVMELWKSVQSADESVLEGFFSILRLTLKNADRAVLPTLIKTIFTFFLDVFDLRHKLQSRSMDLEVVDRVEESAIGSFLELVTKLNEATFKPLFTRLYDWAVIDLSDGKAINDQRLVERKTVLLHVMMGLLNKFRHLLSPYIGILLPHLEELLSAYSSSTITDPALWTLLIRVLGKSFEVDEGAYWTEALYLRLIPLLFAQIPINPELTLLPDSTLSIALASLAGSTTSEPILKALNTGMCKMTRDEGVRVRMAALRCVDAVWERQVEEMVGLVPETVSEYLAELIEDENADVEGMARGVLGRIERVTGSLKEYLE